MTIQITSGPFKTATKVGELLRLDSEVVQKVIDQLPTAMATAREELYEDAKRNGYCD